MTSHSRAIANSRDRTIIESGRDTKSATHRLLLIHVACHRKCAWLLAIKIAIGISTSVARMQRTTLPWLQHLPMPAQSTCCFAMADPDDYSLPDLDTLCKLSDYAAMPEIFLCNLNVDPPAAATLGRMSMSSADWIAY